MSADVERPGSFPSHADMASSTRMPPPPLPLDQSSSLEPHTEDSSMQKTPTRDSFIAPKSQPASNKRDSMSMSSRPSTAGGEEEQRPSSGKEGALDRATSVRSIRSTESQDISMDGTEDGRDQSDQESEAGSDGERPSKKKKGQRFFCTEYPPCSLSFTRSEHLARHIRKHTGERPFVCHCLRRFSRLDNLRQHAQTVHVNEEIPSDSLAATGTRFQRQIRTDRMRTPGVRNRSSTLNSASGHVRGHQRNWSNSSIGSMTSELSTQDDSRRRPPPLAMANIPTHSRGLSLDTYAASAGGRTPDSSYATFYQQSPSGFSTPVSAFSQGPGSPMHTSSLQSPIAFSPRSLQYGDRTPSRRLSVPSSSHPYQQHSHPGPYYNQVPPPYMSPPQSSAASVFPDMPNVFAMPGSPAYPTESRRDTFAEADPRRRTWHPGGWGSQPQYGRPATSGLSYHRTPDALQIMASSPLQTTAAASQGVRLPGIDSFDRAKEQRSAPPRRATSPMDVDSVASHSRRSSIVDTPSKNLDRAGSRDSWGSINQHLTQLDLERFREAQPAQVLPSSASPSFPDPSPLLPAARPVTAPGNQSSPIRREQAQTDIQTTTSVQEVTDPKTTIPESPATPRRAKRQAWYAGPLVTGSTAEIITPVASAVIQVHRTSPEGSSSSDGLPTPFTAASSEVRPAIMHANGYIEAAQPSHESQAQDVSVVAAPKQASSYSVHSDYAPKTRTLQQDLSRPVAQPSQHSQQPSTPSTPSSRQHENTDRLDALVAVATQAVHHQ